MPRGTDRVDEASIQQRLWTPTLMRGVAKLQGWYDAADFGTITAASGAVSQWNDKSGNARHASQATAGKKPTFDPVALRGRPGLTWAAAGTGDDGLLSTVVNFNTTQLGAFAVASLATSAGVGPSNARLVSYAVGADYQDVTEAAIIFRDTLTLNVSGYRETAPGTLNGAVLPAYNTPFIAGGWWDGTNWNNNVNGGTVTQVVSAGTFGGASHCIQIGYNEDGTQSWSGPISEVVFFTGTMPVYLRYLIEGYLSHKWGVSLAAAHPFRNRPPLIGD